MRSIAPFAALIIAPLLMSVQPVHAAGLQGTWSGAGYIKPRSGARERVRCVVSYSQQTARVFSVQANCASNAGSIRQTGEVLKIRSNYYAGDFYNQQFDIGGRVRVSVTGGRQTVTFSSADGGGRLTLKKR